ncbi:MAG TPA: OmpA family protein [Stellaceae bacterium]|nr:OmpA family protein [Stellaceae bacterium]
MLVLFLLSAPQPAAAAFGDCPLVGTLENFEASGPPRTVTYDAEDFWIVEGNAAKKVTKHGKVCRQNYDLKSGAPRTSDIEIMKNYAEGLPALGMTITNTNRAPDEEVYATATKGGAEYWVRVFASNGNTISVMVLQAQAFKSTLLAAAANDCPLIGGLENFTASGPPRIRTYDAEDFRVIEGGAAKKVTKYGRVCNQNYDLNAGAPRSTDLEIIKNYAEGLPAAGMTITNTDRNEQDEVFATVTKDGTEYWSRVYPSNGNTVSVMVLQVQPFKSALLPAGVNDCPLVGGLQGFEPSGALRILTYEAEDFRVVEGGEAKKVTKYGKVCTQYYSQKAGQPHSTDLEIMKNYAEGLPAAGMTTTNTDRNAQDELYATVTKDGTEYWTRIWPSNGNTATVMVLQVQPFKSTLLPPGADDCPLVGGLQGFEPSGKPQTRTYASEDFRVVDGGKAQTVTKSGKVCTQIYGQKAGQPHSTDLEIMKNYAEGLPALGMTITNTDRNEGDALFATMSKDGTESWVRVWPSNGNTASVIVLQIEPFKSSLKAAQVVEEPTKTELKVTALRGGQPIPGAWCGVFPPGKTDGTPIGRARSGEAQTVAPDTYDVGCFVEENGVTTSGWLKGQHIGAGTTELTVEMPAKRAQVDLVFAAPAATQETVRPDQGDFPYLPSLPGSTLTGGRVDLSPFYAQPADAKQPELVANGSIVKEYRPPAGVGLAQLFGAYHTALLKAHWTIISEQHSAGVLMTAHYGDNGRNIWATLHLAESNYSIAVADATIVQSRLAADLGAKCHLALTGVLFDFDKSTLKPESDAVLQQVAALMAKDPALKLEIQGHTDNVGGEAYNQTLSEARARSVVTWLTQHKVAPARLTARGYGKTRPIASNDTDDGRAHNRRVEIANPACKQ